MPIPLKPVPKTLAEAVNRIVENLSPDEIEFIKTEGGNAAHFTTGMALRNEWGLWHDSDLAKYFKTVLGLGHADDMSGIILDSVTAHVRGVGFNPGEESKRYHQYWRKQGLDPLTLEKINGSFELFRPS